MATVAVRSDRCYIGLPRWIWTVIIGPLFVAGVLAAVGWAWSQSSAMSALNERVDSHEHLIDKMDGKLDRILERLPSIGKAGHLADSD